MDDYAGLKARREAVTAALIRRHEDYYDLNLQPLGCLAARGDFYMHSEKYVLVKKARLWEADCNEFVYIFSTEELTEAGLRECIAYGYRNGMEKIHPGPAHMCSYITVLVICESCTKQAEKALRRCRIRRNFKLSFHGWMELQAGVAVCEDGRVTVNGSGKRKRKLLKSVMEECL